MKAMLPFAAFLSLLALLTPAALGPRPALLRWLAGIAPWLLAAAASWTLVGVWGLRRVAELLLRTPGRRMEHTTRA